MGRVSDEAPRAHARKLTSRPSRHRYVDYDGNPHWDDLQLAMKAKLNPESDHYTPGCTGCVFGDDYPGYSSAAHQCSPPLSPGQNCTMYTYCQQDCLTP